ncbi:MAG: ABC transporter ATP-binding protein [Chitinispirillaceae bacterium]|nr:ABC transporter ATP-binding protein [Chitinispirillaceae bacterium]
MAPLLEVAGISAGYGKSEVLLGVDVRIDEDQRWAVLGRNGTGKSTLIRVLAGLLVPARGAVLLRGKPVADYPSRQRACQIAYMQQKAEAVIPYTVYDFVMLGRYARMGLFGIPGDNDRQAVVQALEYCEVRDLGNRMMTTLSGGELQRVLLAGALAQETPLLLLDEPTTFLDPAHERHFLRALESAHTMRELTTVMVTHDINTALTSCTHVLALCDGKVFFSGTARDFDARCPEALETLFGIPFECYAGEKHQGRMYGTWGGAL